MNTVRCSGCHSGDFPDFDHYVDEHHITPDEVPAAFAAWLHDTTDWDGDTREVTECRS